MDSITANPFAILQAPVCKIPRRAMAREVWRGYLVEGKTTFGEYPALWKGDFLDFHASPFALAIASDASEIKAQIASFPSGA